MSTHVDQALDMLAEARIRNVSDKLLAGAQVHATLAVEAAVRDLIEEVRRGE